MGRALVRTNAKGRVRTFLRNPNANPKSLILTLTLSLTLILTPCRNLILFTSKTHQNMSSLWLYFTKNPLARALRVGKVATLAHARFALREPGKSFSRGVAAAFGGFG